MPQPSDLKLSMTTFLAICFIGFAAIAVIGLSLMPATSPPLSAETIITTFEGNGDQATAEFTVQENWEIRWEADTDESLEAIAWQTADNQGSMIMKMHRRPLRTQGRVNIAPPGTYHLEVTGIGDWKMTIVQF